jgi:hypothetical protein
VQKNSERSVKAHDQRTSKTHSPLCQIVNYSKGREIGGPTGTRIPDKRIMSLSLTDYHNSSQQPAFSKLLYHLALLIVVVGLGL